MQIDGRSCNIGQLSSIGLHRAHKLTQVEWKSDDAGARYQQMKNAHGERIFVLIIENGIGKMESVHKSLQKADCEHGFAKSREDAVKIMTTQLYDFVIMDYVMPGMSGKEFQNIVSVNDSKVKIIFTFPKSELSPEIKIKDCQWLGVPFDNGELLHLIQGAQHNGS